MNQIQLVALSAQLLFEQSQHKLQANVCKQFVRAITKFVSNDSKGPFAQFLAEVMEPAQYYQRFECPDANSGS